MTENVVPILPEERAEDLRAQARELDRQADTGGFSWTERVELCRRAQELRRRARNIEAINTRHQTATGPRVA